MGRYSAQIAKQKKGLGYGPSIPPTRAQLEAEEKFRRSIKAAITLLPDDKKAEFSILPSTAKEAQPVLLAFNKPHLVGHIGRNPALSAAFIAASDSTKKMFEITAHKAMASQQAAQRSTTVCPKKRAQVEYLVAGLQKA